MKDDEENAKVPSPDNGDDRYVVPFENEFEAQRRRSELESRLQAALKELDRQRGRVIALEDQLRTRPDRVRIRHAAQQRCSDSDRGPQ